MLDVLVRKALATGTLRQSYVATPSSICTRGLPFRNLWYAVRGFVGDCNVGGGPLVGRIRDRRSGGFVISAMEDVVELRDGIATFDAYWHNARKRLLHMIVPVSRKFVDCRCCEGPTLQILRAVTLGL